MVVSGALVVAGFWALASTADEQGALQNESALEQSSALVTKVKGTSAEADQLCGPSPRYLTAWQLVTQLNRLKAGLVYDTSASRQPPVTLTVGQRYAEHLEFFERCWAEPHAEATEPG